MTMRACFHKQDKFFLLWKSEQDPRSLTAWWNFMVSGDFAGLREKSYSGTNF